MPGLCVAEGFAFNSILFFPSFPASGVESLMHGLATNRATSLQTPQEAGCRGGGGWRSCFSPSNRDHNGGGLIVPLLWALGLALHT